MAKVALNIAKAYDNGFIADLEKSKYFQLHKNAATRADLYSFAIAIAKMEGKEPSAPQTVDSFVRAEYLGNYEALLSCLYFDENLKDNTEQIDEICNRDEVYALAEKYANAGFGVLKDWAENLDKETLFYKLIGYMDNCYQEIKDEVNLLI
nr:hypothetical protein [uncultured Bacteroides sp.]